MNLDLALRSRWLTLMRTSTHRALGRECDYARAEGDVDTFDPIGLLALAAGYECEGHGSVWRCYPGADGAYISRHGAAFLARQVGLDPELLFDLCMMNDGGARWTEMADWVEGHCGAGGV